MNSNSRKKLLILGATNIISEIVYEAQKMGIYTIVTDYYENSPAKKVADEAWLVDVFDFETLLNKIREENVDGILTGFTDSLMPAYIEVSKMAGKPCYISDEQLNFSIKKNIFKDICREYKVPVVPEFEYGSEIEYPVIVKPVDNSGSRGIYICNNADEFEVNYKKSLEFSKSKKVLIEKYMTGEEIVIYYAFQDGEISLTAVCDRYTNKDQDGLAQLPTAYTFPSKYLDLYIKNIHPYVENMFRGLNIKNGSMFLQAFVQNGQIYLYEPGFRLNGAQEHIIVSNICGFNTMQMLINFALTGKMSDEIRIKNLANPYFNKSACKLSPLVKTGKIFQIIGLDKIKNISGVIDIKPLHNEGDFVKGKGTLDQIIARFFIVAEDDEKLADIIDDIQNILQVKDEAGNEMLYGLFDTNIIRKVGNNYD